MTGLSCRQCAGNMKKTVVSSGNCLGIAVALLLFAFGVWLCFTVVGVIIGIPVCICALFVGGTRRKVWKCTSCGCIIERA